MQKIPIFVINLEKDTEKREYMKELCKQYSLDCMVSQAVYGKNLSENEITKVYDKERALIELSRELTVGEIGCALSHMNIYQKMIDENIEIAVIFEDDIVFDNSINEALQSINNFPLDWECVLLCYYRMAHYKKNYCLNFHNRLKVSNDLKIVRFTALMHSTASYIINLSGASKLLATLREGIYKPIDHYTGDENHINLYGLHPRIVKIDSVFGSQSTIAAERQQIEKKTIIRSEHTIGLNNETDNFRKILKKIGLFPFFKKVNIQRQKIQVPIEQLIYHLRHIRSCITRPKIYKKFHRE